MIGIKYDLDSLDEEQCPTQYTMKTYDSEAELLADEAEMTHWGAVRALSCLRLRLFALCYS